MDAQSTKFLESTFRQYYYDYMLKVPVPTDITHREFGYQKFGMTGMIRHIQIRDAGELRVMLMRNVPSDVYYSNARYTFPDMDMSDKGWQGADLIFDIDAKDLDLPCRAGHVFGVCVNCHRVAKAGQACDACGETMGIRQKSLPCKKCMDAAKRQVLSLMDVLCDDLGILHDSIDVFFSGNEGFHLHVAHEAFFNLDARARAGLVEYIMLKGMIPETMGMRKGSIDRDDFPNLNEAGWRGRFAKAVFGSKTRRASVISDILRVPAGDKRYSKFQDMMDSAVSEIGIKIDPNVTVDVRRIFRMPGTLNSKSGMCKILCADIAKFDPYVDAIVLDDRTGMINVAVDCPVGFRLGGKRIGPYRNETAELPVYAAAYLVCKGFAKTD